MHWPTGGNAGNDGYVVYSLYQDLYPDKHRSSCLVHIRRYFVDALEECREIAMWFIERFGWLFANEHEFVKQGLTGEERRKARLKRSRSIMDSIKKELEKYERSGYKHLGMKIKQALVYAKKEWHAFETVLQNGEVELSNNLARADDASYQIALDLGRFACKELEEQHEHRQRKVCS